MGSQELYGLGKDGFEAFHGSHRYYLGSGEVWTCGQEFGPVGSYIDVGQGQCSGYFAEEGGFFVIGFHQRQVDVWGPDFQGERGESGAGAYV